MNLESLNQEYFDITHLIQIEFDRNEDKYGDKIKCRKGCSQCCHQIFRITYSDSFVINKFLNSRSHQFKNILKAKAAEYVNKNIPDMFDSNEFHLNPKLACPALNQDGECLIYEARPVICRRFGPPIYDYKNPGKVFACELNFSNGEEIIDDELIPNQTIIGKRWDMFKTEFNSEYGIKKNASTSIAEAILNS